MSFQSVNLGAVGTGAGGDTLRVAIQKINANFGEVYSAAGSAANAKALNGLAGVADRLPYFTGAGALSLATLTAKARELIAAETPLAMRAILELVKQTSTTDTAAGVMLLQGAYGLGNWGVNIISADLNGETRSGWVGATIAGTLNKPIATDGVCLTSGWTSSSGGRCSQMFFSSTAATRIFVRTLFSSWGGWTEVWHGGNQLNIGTTALAARDALELGSGKANILSYGATNGFDGLTGSRFLRTGVDGPLGATICGGFSSGVTASIEQQIAARLGRWFIRSKGDSTGDYWSELYHQRSAVGTVSQSAGVPTGAIIERGSNANGAYVRFADGTQICTGYTTTETCATAYGSTGLFYNNAPNKGTYPAAFVAVPTSVTATADRAGGTGLARITGSSVVASTLTATPEYRGFTDTSGQNITFFYIAIGRWF